MTESGQAVSPSVVLSTHGMGWIVISSQCNRSRSASIWSWVWDVSICYLPRRSLTGFGPAEAPRQLTCTWGTCGGRKHASTNDRPGGCRED
eukprot:7968058-Pyramimonas_sp.AAC.2